MTKLLVAERTERAIHNFLSVPTHALLLLGPEGVGKYSLARSIASSILQLNEEDLDGYPYFSIISTGGKSISIETIRNLKTSVNLKTIGSRALRRVIMIADAHLMTIEAQNALLKTLEEPPEDTLIIMTALPDEGLLPTILSRLTVIRVEVPSLESALAFFGDEYDVSEVKKYYFLSDGRPGMLASLLADNQAHPMVSAVATAKKLISCEPFERQSLVNELAKDRAGVDNLLTALALVYRSLLVAAADKHDKRQLTRLTHVFAAINNLQELRRSNPSSKLLLTDLMWHL